MSIEGDVDDPSPQQLAHADAEEEALAATEEAAAAAAVVGSTTTGQEEVATYAAAAVDYTDDGTQGIQYNKWSRNGYGAPVFKYVCAGVHGWPFLNADVYISQNLCPFSSYC
jgi:hypothetical protein